MSVLRSPVEYLNSGCIARVVQLMNQNQFDWGASVYCVDSIRTRVLCEKSGLRSPIEFAAYLVNRILGLDLALFPTALIFSLHIPCEHFITLLLRVLQKELLVYDSLRTSESTKKAVEKLAIAFGLTSADVKHREMVQQSESPASRCGLFNVATMNGLRHNTPPRKVSNSPK